MLITTRKLERELNISLKRNTKFQNLFEIFFLAAESKCKMFHFLSIMHTWTDFATFGAIEQHVPWIFLAFTARCPGFTMFVLILASWRKKVKQYTCTCIAQSYQISSTFLFESYSPESGSHHAWSPMLPDLFFFPNFAFPLVPCELIPMQVISVRERAVITRAYTEDCI